MKIGFIKQVLPLCNRNEKLKQIAKEFTFSNLTEEEFLEQKFFSNLAKNTTFKPYTQFTKLFINQYWYRYSDTYKCTDGRRRRACLKVWRGTRKGSHRFLNDATVKVIRAFCAFFAPDMEVFYKGSYISFITDAGTPCFTPITKDSTGSNRL